MTSQLAQRLPLLLPTIIGDSSVADPPLRTTTFVAGKGAGRRPAG